MGFILLGLEAATAWSVGFNLAAAAKAEVTTTVSALGGEVRRVRRLRVSTDHVMQIMEEAIMAPKEAR